MALVMSLFAFPPEPPPPAEHVRIEAVQGRVEALQGPGLPTRVPVGSTLSGGAVGHLETGVGALARVGWPGRASARIEGRAGVEWSGDGLSVLECQALELEVRRGPLTLRTQDGWTLRIERGALSLRAGQGRGYRLENHAGLSASLWHSSGPFLRPVELPAPGEVCWLPGLGLAPSRAKPEGFAVWRSYEWPWGLPPAPLLVTPPPPAPMLPEAVSVLAEPMVEPEPVAEPMVEPEPVAEPVVEPEPVAEPVVEPEPVAEPMVEPEPVAEPVVEPEPVAEPVVEPETVAEPVVEPTPPPEPAPQPAPVPAPAPAPQPVVEAPKPAPPAPVLRLPAAKLQPEAFWRRGPIVFQRHSELRVDTAGSDGMRLRLSTQTSARLRVYGASRVFDLEPGGLIVFNAAGEPVAVLGAVEKPNEGLPDEPTRAKVPVYP
jgi:hypothetical protein